MKNEEKQRDHKRIRLFLSTQILVEESEKEKGGLGSRVLPKIAEEEEGRGRESERERRFLTARFL